MCPSPFAEDSALTDSHTKLSSALTATAMVATLFISAFVVEGKPARGQEVSANSSAASEESKPSSKETATAKDNQHWISLNDHWEPCEFGGDGEITMKDGLIKMEFGQPLTGVRWSGPFEGEEKKASAETKKKQPPVLPRDNYEVRWECRRDRGVDFVCAYTFPVGKEVASLVMGGWGGGVTGISSIDGHDASDNETTMFKAYDDERWYKARVRVEKAQITVWIDEVKMFDVPRKDRKFDIRFEMDPCTPMGIANFECDSQFRNLAIRRLNPAELAKEESDQ
ncbi:family 16 glycoside hydrolase [Roseiconus lacunae]|uniref:family 16 glycoside hydrolase n=1 Tax=Roseiconus lacunae TaxID=2605694 RepID=UPI00308AB938|nr:family 16 glycoside hydrolase [Stieleria sp. HD01]